MQPELLLVGWGERTVHALPPATGPALYCPDFYLEDSTPWVTFAHTAVVSRDELLALLRPSTDLMSGEWHWQHPDFERFAGAVKTIKSGIARGDLVKAVPVVFETSDGEVTPQLRHRLVHNAVARADKRIPYGYWTADSGVIGATPEILFNYNQYEQTLETMALAGTRRTDLEKVSSLLHDPKEMYEHELVVQALKRKLKTLGELSVSPTYVWELGAISHLRTDISVELRELPKGSEFFTDIVRLLHPTPALGVASSRFDFGWLKNVEGEIRRGRFGAPFGVANLQGRSCVLVAIRNVQWEGRRIFLGAGCGVVAQSELQREWDELEIKRKTVRDLLEL